MVTLYTLKEVAKSLRMSERSLQRLKAEGKIEHYKRPGQKGAILFSEEHVINYLKTYCS